MVATNQQVIGQSFFTVVQAFLGASPIIIDLVAGLMLDDGISTLTAGTVIAFTRLRSRLFFPVWPGASDPDHMRGAVAGSVAADGQT